MVASVWVGTWVFGCCGLFALFYIVFGFCCIRLFGYCFDVCFMFSFILIGFGVLCIYFVLCLFWDGLFCVVWLPFDTCLAFMYALCFWCFEVYFWFVCTCRLFACFNLLYLFIVWFVVFIVVLMFVCLIDWFLCFNLRLLVFCCLITFDLCFVLTLFATTVCVSFCCFVVWLALIVVLDFGWVVKWLRFCLLLF